MTDLDRAGAEPQGIFEHEERFVSRLAAGGFQLRTANQQPVRVLPAADRLSIDDPGGLDGWWLERSGEGGFVLLAAGGLEAARTMGGFGLGAEVGLKYLALDDGRLFRIVLRGPHDGRYELTGWETPGAYLTARPARAGWTLTPAPACGGLADIRVLALLLAAEVLDAEETLERRAT